MNNLKCKIKLLIFIFYCSLFIIHCSLVKAQQIQGAVLAGFNLSQVDGDQIYGFHKIGLDLGVSAIIPIKKKFDIAIETIFSQEGSYQSPQFSTSLYNNGHDSTGEYELKLTYVGVPVLFQYKDKGGFTFGAGLAWNRLIDVKEKEYEFNPKAKINGVVWDNVSLNSGAYSKSDWDVLADIRFKVYKNIQFNFRYTYSFIKIRDRYFFYFKKERYQYNNFLSFRLIWIINSKIVEEN